MYLYRAFYFCLSVNYRADTHRHRFSTGSIPQYRKTRFPELRCFSSPISFIIKWNIFLYSRFIFLNLTGFLMKTRHTNPFLNRYRDFFFLRYSIFHLLSLLPSLQCFRFIPLLVLGISQTRICFSTKSQIRISLAALLHVSSSMIQTMLKIIKRRHFINK